MSRSRSRSGITIIELVWAIFTAVLLLAALYVLYGADQAANELVFNDTFSIQQSREPLDTLGDHLRDAQSCQSANGCTGGVQGSVIDSAAVSDITYYTSGSTATGSPVRYHLVGTNLVRTSGSTNTNVLFNLSSLSLTYYKSSTYNSSSLTTTVNSHAPTAAELPSLAAIRITASTTTSGRSAQYSTLVRLRNSPVKTNLKGN